LSRKGITLVEFCVVIFIFALLFSMLSPAVQYSREAARSMTCESSLRQISIAIQNHESKFSRFPISDLRAETAAIPVGGAIYHLSNELEIRVPLPNESPYAISNRTLASNSPGILICPSESRQPSASGMITYSLHSQDMFSGQVGLTSYATNAGVPPFVRQFNQGPIATRLSSNIIVRAASVSDGLSNTLAAWESSRIRPCYEMNGKRFCRNWNELLDSSTVSFETFDSYGRSITVRKIDYFSFLVGWVGSSAGSILPIDRDGNIETINTESAKVINKMNLSRGPFSWHSGFALSCFLDGHTQKLSNNMEFRLGSALSGMSDQSTIVVNE